MKREEAIKEKICYPVVLTFEEGQEIAVEIPDLDVATSGVSEEDALSSARELLGLVVYGLEEDKEEVPKPSSVRDIHIEDNQMVMLVDVYMPSVIPQPKTGHWIEMDANMYTCSNCSHCFTLVPKDNHISQFNYCPYCRTKMVESEKL